MESFSFILGSIIGSIISAVLAVPIGKCYHEAELLQSGYFKQVNEYSFDSHYTTKVIPLTHNELAAKMKFVLPSEHKSEHKSERKDDYPKIKITYDQTGSHLVKILVKGYITIDVEQLPEIPYTASETEFNRHSLPLIYFVQDGKGNILYIGQTTRSDRFREHHKLTQFKLNDATSVKYWHLTASVDSSDIEAYERQLIEYYRPKLNVIGNPDKGKYSDYKNHD